MHRFLGKGTLSFFSSLSFLGVHSFDGLLRVIFFTSVVELTYDTVFVDIVQRCNFCCVECLLTSRASQNGYLDSD